MAPLSAKIQCAALALLLGMGPFSAAAAESAETGGDPFPGYTVEVVHAEDYPDLAPLELSPKEPIKRLTVVAPGGIAEQLQLHPGDLILRCHRDRKEQAGQSLLPQAGDKMHFQILRFTNGKGVIEECDAVMPRVPGTVYEAYAEPESARAFTRAARRSTLRKDAEKALQEAARKIAESIERSDRASKTAEEAVRTSKAFKNAAEEWDDLERRLAAASEWHDPFLMPAVNYLFHRPAALEAVGRTWAELAARKTAVAALLGLERAAVAFDGSAPAPPPPGFLPRLPEEGAPLEVFLDYVAAVLDCAGSCNQQALRALPPEKVLSARLQCEEWAGWLPECRTPAADPDPARGRRMLELCRTLALVDREALRRQTAAAGTLLDPVFLSRLAQAAEPVKTQEIAAQRDTPWGKIVIAGTGNDLHADPCAVLIDLGGNDRYLGGHAASMPFRRPTALVIDLEGNDHYEAAAPLAQGCGIFGVGILFDASGDDVYLASELAQGCGFGGFGLLIDLEGNDLYAARALAQGTAFFGAGILADGTGDDGYSAGHFAQGLGLVRGFGLLSDGSGRDRYRCKGAKAASGKNGVGFEGWGQGVGLGMHPYCSGGIGMLVDAGSGDNLFDGGTHTMGGGCARGFGMIACLGKGNDRYHATRYALGFALHQAAGFALEAGGNDVYDTLAGMIAGVAWDRSLARFVDANGDDRYDAGSGFALGAAALNGIAFFRDDAGKDLYRIAEGPAVPVRNGAAGGASLAVFCDEGGAEDVYPPGRQNRSSAGELRFSVFIDR